MSRSRTSWRTEKQCESRCNSSRPTRQPFRSKATNAAERNGLPGLAVKALRCQRRQLPTDRMCPEIQNAYNSCSCAGHIMNHLHALVVLVFTGSVAFAEQPNIVFILADDLGRHDCG